MSKAEINDYLSKCDEDLANNVIYRVYGMPGPIFMEKNDDTPPTPEPGPDYSIPFYVENITQEDETLTITGIGSEENGYLEIPVEYSTDGTNWSSFGTTGATPLTMTIQPGDKVYLRATTNSWDAPINRRCEISGISKIGGNIMSLLYGSSFTGNETTFPSGSMTNFYYLFDGLDNVNINLTSASELILPATTLAEECYNSMFSNCTSLITAPQLPATTLADSCYENMFQYCSSLTTAPALPATTLAPGCYFSMFKGCTSLTTAPELPATTLAEECYNSMFSNCSSLTTAPALPATTLAPGCYFSMFYDCESLTTAPELPATTLDAGCYRNMFDGCTSLTINNIPQLPATTLAESCYENMFISITMGEDEYSVWCSENIPAAANYDESIHGVLFRLSGGPTPLQ